jgi:hypothetical protein
MLARQKNVPEKSWDFYIIFDIKKSETIADAPSPALLRGASQLRRA